MKDEIELIKELESLDVCVQANALMNLLGLNCYNAVSHIIPLLQSNDLGIRSTSVYVLGELGDKDDNDLITALINALNDSEEIVRSDVIDALSLLLVEKAIPKISKLLLEDTSTLVRVSAAEALGEIGNASNICTLDIVINNPNEDSIVCRYAKHSRELLNMEN